MKLFTSFSCLIIAGLIATLPASAQDYQQMRDAILQQQKQTRSEINRIEDLISQYQNRLNEAEQRFDKIYEQYEDTKRLLALQEQKIASLQKERNQINEEITVTERKLKQQEDKLKQLVENYKSTMRYLYKHGRTSQLALILSSASLNQMMVRNYYLKKFENYREEQAAEIKQTQEELKQSQQQLDDAAQRNEEVMAEIRTEKEKLEEKTQQQRVNVNLLSKDRIQIEQKLNESQRQKDELNSTIARLIAREEEIREARQQELERQQQEQEAENLASNSESDNISAPEESNAPAETNLETNTSTEYVGEVGYISDSRLSEIEASFATQKGSLSWPVESNTISEHFGRQRHEVYGTVTDNLGIEIVTEPQQEVHVVHDGYVFAVQPMTGYGDVVFVKHGKFITAYGNLSRVLVRKNTILQEGDLLGYSGDQNSTRGESVFFMLRNGSQNVNPETWLRNR